LQLKLLDDHLHTRGMVQKLLENFGIATRAQAVTWHVAKVHVPLMKALIAQR
jgi:hypothetical protein